MNIFYQDEDCWLGWTEEGEFVSLHTEVGKWSLGKYKKYISILAKFLTYINKDVYALAVTDKHKKFNELFGFSEIMKTDEGYVMGIIKHE